MSRFRRRLMGLAQLREAKRKDFVRVEYIENTSTAYIDTNIQFNLSMEINGKFQNMDNTTSERDRRYFGGATTWKGYGLSVSENIIMLNEALSWDADIKTYNVSTPFEIHYKNKSVTVNNYTVNLNTKRGDSTEVPTMYLLAEHRPNTAALSFLIGRLYYFKIYNENDVLVRDYIPMYQISTDTYGLWDRVNEEFYTSPNGVKFSGGREVIDENYVLMDYIENPSTAYLNTRVNFYQLSPSKYINLNLEVLEQKSIWSTVYGARYKPNDVDSIIIQTSNNNKWFSKQAGVSFYLSLPIVGKHNFKLVDGHNYVDNVSFSDKYPISSYSGAYMCLLGTSNLQTNTVTDLGLHCKIFDCQIGNGNELVRDYVPVRQISSGKYGLYDKINGNFISSSNSVEFTSVE